MEWKKYSEEKPEVGDICLCRFKSGNYRLTRYSRPFDEEKKYNPDYFIWENLDNSLTRIENPSEFLVESCHEWLKINTNR